jgi:hypothetical protein
MGLFVVPIDTAVGHFARGAAAEYEPAWTDAAQS